MTSSHKKTAPEHVHDAAGELRTYDYRGYKISINQRGEVVKLERVVENPSRIVAELYLKEEETHQLDRIFAILEWSKSQMLEALDAAFSADYSQT